MLVQRALPAVAISTKAFELQISSHELSKNNKYFVPLILNESSNSKITSEKTQEIQSLFEKQRKAAGCIDEKSQFCQFLVERFQF